MKIKRINEDFDIFKNYDNSYKRQVKDEITGIITEVYGISEKSFKAYEYAMEISKGIVEQEEFFIEKMEKDKRRKQLCAELIYERYIDNIKDNMNDDLKNKTK